MDKSDLIHSSEFAEHLVQKWAEKMFYPPRSVVYLLLGQWLGAAIPTTPNSAAAATWARRTSKYPPPQDLRELLIDTPYQPKILELGYGTGDFTKVVEEISLTKDVEYTGVDISESWQTIVRKRLPNLNFTIGEGAHLEYPDNHFDFSFTVDVLRHNESWTGILKELSRVTKREVFIADIFESESPTKDSFHKREHELHSGGGSHEWSVKYFAKEAQKYFNHVNVQPIIGYSHRILILSNEDERITHVFQTPVHIFLKSTPAHQPMLFGRASKILVFIKASLSAVRNIFRSTIQNKPLSYN